MKFLFREDAPAIEVKKLDTVTLNVVKGPKSFITIKGEDMPRIDIEVSTDTIYNVLRRLEKEVRNQFY